MNQTAVTEREAPSIEFYIDTSSLREIPYDGKGYRFDTNGRRVKVTKDVLDELRFQARKGRIPRKLQNFASSGHFERVDAGYVDEYAIRRIRSTYTRNQVRVKEEPVSDADSRIIASAIKDSRKDPRARVYVISEDSHIRDTIPGLGIPNLHAITLDQYLNLFSREENKESQARASNPLKRTYSPQPQTVLCRL